MGDTLRKRREMRRERFDQINVVPFIDITLVLLVIVLATATFITKNEVSVDLPKSSSDTKIPPKSISISIDKNGTIYYGKDRVDIGELSKRLSKLNPKKDAVTLNADQQSQFQRFVSVIDILKKKGFEKISITTLQ